MSLHLDRQFLGCKRQGSKHQPLDNKASCLSVLPWEIHISHFQSDILSSKLLTKQKKWLLYLYRACLPNYYACSSHLHLWLVHLLDVPHTANICNAKITVFGCISRGGGQILPTLYCWHLLMFSPSNIRATEYSGLTDHCTEMQSLTRKYKVYREIPVMKTGTLQ